MEVMRSSNGLYQPNIALCCPIGGVLSCPSFLH